MITLRYYFLLMGILLLPGRLGAWFSAGNGGQPAEYLHSLSGGARGTALGLAQTALLGQTQGIYANPAAIASLWWQEIGLGVTPLFGGAQLVTFNYGHPFSTRHVFGVSLIRLASGDAEKTNELGETLGSFSEQSNAFILSYGRMAGRRLHYGFAVKAITQDIDTLSARALSADAGMAIEVSPEQTWAAALTNVIPARLGPDDLVLLPKVGFRRELLREKLFLSGDVSPLDAVRGRWSPRWAGGIEYRAMEWFSLRAGVNYKQASAGFGIATRQMDFDYAVVVHPLDVYHTFTLAFRYGFIPSEAEQRIRGEWDELHAAKEAAAKEIREEEERMRRERARLRREEHRRVRFFEAQRYFEQKRFDDARKLLEGILAEDPAHENARALLGEIRYRTDAAGMSRRLGDGQALYRQGKYSEALTEAAAVLGLQSDNQAALTLAAMARAQMLIKEKKFGEAKKELVGVLKAEPTNKEADELLKRLQTVLDISSEEE